MPRVLKPVLVLVAGLCALGVLFALLAGQRDPAPSLGDPVVLPSAGQSPPTSGTRPPEQPGTETPTAGPDRDDGEPELVPPELDDLDDADGGDDGPGERDASDDRDGAGDRDGADG